MAHIFLQDDPKVSVAGANDDPATIPTPEQLGSLLITYAATGTTGQTATAYAALEVGATAQWVPISGIGATGATGPTGGSQSTAWATLEVAAGIVASATLPAPNTMILSGLAGDSTIRGFTAMADGTRILLKEDSGTPNPIFLEGENGAPGESIFLGGEPTLRLPALNVVEFVYNAAPSAGWYLVGAPIVE